jgi:hypothetical protein
MPCVGFEPTIPASEREKTVNALERSATVTGNASRYIGQIFNCFFNIIYGLTDFELLGKVETF